MHTLIFPHSMLIAYSWKKSEVHSGRLEIFFHNAKLWIVIYIHFISVHYYSLISTIRMINQTLPIKIKRKAYVIPYLKKKKKILMS